jgi:hypothetical protein
MSVFITILDAYTVAYRFVLYLHWRQSTMGIYNGPSNKFIFRATYGNSIVCNIFPAQKMTQETSDILTK